MQTLMFEVLPKAGHEDYYFRRAMALKPILETYPGLLFLDRYRSLENPAKILSFQRWVDEAAIVAWRSDPTHQKAQKAGRNTHFADYRIRVSHILKRETKDGMSDHDDISIHDETRLFVAAIGSGRPSLEGGEMFKSLNLEESYMTIIPVTSHFDAEALMGKAKENPHHCDIMLCLSHRDYTLTDRAEAPQDFEPVIA